MTNEAAFSAIVTGVRKRLPDGVDECADIDRRFATWRVGAKHASLGEDDGRLNFGLGHPIQRRDVQRNGDAFEGPTEADVTAAVEAICRYLTTPAS